MTLYLVDILATLLMFDINICVIAKGMHAKKKDGEWSWKFAQHLLAKERKETKIQYSILICNLLMVLVNLISAFVRYLREGESFLQSIEAIIEQISQGWKGLVLCVGAIGILTVTFMIIVYRLVNLEPVEKDENGNRHLSVSDIDKEYIKFSKPESVDGHSILMLIAGDLSFLGDIPEVKSIKGENRRRKCKEYLSDVSQDHSKCKQGCSRIANGKCIEQSEQFAQLLKLRKNGVTLRVICKQPNDSNDVAYKRRLGRLKKMFADNIDIRFLPDNTSESGICVLGRIKVNGGIKELFWHWKDPEKAETYIVPNTKKIDSSENKTLIYLFETVLWQFAHPMEAKVLDECIKKYEETIQID